MNEDKRNEFVDRLKVTEEQMSGSETSEETSKDPITPFNPDYHASYMFKEQILKDFSEILKDTNSRNLIAFHDPKVRELIDYVVAAIIVENKRINKSNSTYPLKVIRRYKSHTSLAEKITKYKNQKRDDMVTDDCAIKIIPQEDSSIFFSGGDSILAELIKEREQNRKFLIKKNKLLEENQQITFEKYCSECKKILDKLEQVFLSMSDGIDGYASERIKHYESLKVTLDAELAQAKKYGQDDNMPMEELLDISTVKYDDLLEEFKANYHNKITMYQLQKSVKKTFENSELLKNLGVSLSDDPSRTKKKRTDSSYASDFMGIDLTIQLNNGETIVLPIECQTQSIEQFEDGNSGFACHTTSLENKDRNLPDKPKRKLWDHVGEINGKRLIYTPQSNLPLFVKFLSDVIHNSPESASAEIERDDPEDDRVTITCDDLYNSFKKVSRIPKKHIGFKFFKKFFGELYQEKNLLLPSGESQIYIGCDEIPNLNTDPEFYEKFFQELRDSLDETFAKAYGNTDLNPALPKKEEAER